MIGWGKPFRITRLQMERIISSKGQKPLQPDAEPLLREQRVSNHLPHRKSEASNTDTTDIKTPLRDAEGTFDGVRWCDDNTEHFIFLHFFSFFSSQAIWVISVSPTAQWPAVGLLARAFCRPLSLNSQPPFSDPQTPVPPFNLHKNADMLEHKPGGNNQSDESRLPGTWGDRMEIPGIHIFICSEFCVNMRTKAELEFWPLWHTCTFYQPISDSSSLEAEVSILSKRKPLQSDNPASLSGHPYFSRGSVIHCSWKRFSRNTSAFRHSQQAFSVFAGNGSFNCFPWHGPR